MFTTWEIREFLLQVSNGMNIFLFYFYYRYLHLDILFSSLLIRLLGCSYYQINNESTIFIPIYFT